MYSFVRRCAFHNGYSTAIGAFAIQGLEIDQNIVHHTVGPGLENISGVQFIAFKLPLWWLNELLHRHAHVTSNAVTHSLTQSLLLAIRVYDFKGDLGDVKN